MIDYFTYFPVYQAGYTHYEYRQVMDYIDSFGIDFANIYMSSRFFDSKQYMFYLCYFKVDPSWYQQDSAKDWHLEENG